VCCVLGHEDEVCSGTSKLNLNARGGHALVAISFCNHRRIPLLCWILASSIGSGDFATAEISGVGLLVPRSTPGLYLPTYIENSFVFCEEINKCLHTYKGRFNFYSV
jgi:hypothetical protein